jgi:tripartite motif-containing protein 71
MRHALLVVVFGVLLLPLRSAAQAPSWLAQWGTPGTGPGQFDEPMGVAVDASGRVYVADAGNQRVQVFADDGTLLSAWPGECWGGIAINDASTLYLGNRQYVRSYTASGALLNEWAAAACTMTYCAPSGLATDASGNIFVGDDVINCIWKYDSGGRLLTRWGTRGSANGQFGFFGPVGVAVDEHGTVYATDPDNHRVQKFTGDGTYLGQFGQPGSGPGQLVYPVGIASDRHGHIYLTDPPRIQEFTYDGAVVAEWGTFGNGEGQFDQPHSLAVDVAGRVYVADTGNHRIQVFGAAVTPVRQRSWGTLKTIYR